MSDSSNPEHHQALERQFMSHVEKMLLDERLRVDTTHGRRPVTMMIRDVSQGDRGVELKRIMSEMGRPDRSLESRMPAGKTLDVTLAQMKWWIWKSTVGRMKVICVSPTRDLLKGGGGSQMSASDLGRTLGEIPPSLNGLPQTIIVMSTSGFAAEAREAARRTKERTVILAWPNGSGGWSTAGPAETGEMAELFNPEGETEKRQRVRTEIEASRVDLMSGGLATDKLAGKTQLPIQLVESELKSYARENPGLTAKKLDGRVVLFREGGAPVSTGVSAGGIDMPFMERFKALFSRKGEIEKKIAFLSERRTALSQQRDRSYEDMGALESREGEMRQQFKDAGGDITRRRIASQLVQLRKDIERRQQLLSVLNQQINVVSTHLHNLELQQQGKTANLPGSDEMAADAAAAEDVLAELEANSELADSVGSAAHGGMSTEEQAIYDELMAEKGEIQSGATPGADAPIKAAGDRAGATPSKAASPAGESKRRTEPEAG